MPELPDLVYIEKKLYPLVLDREIRGVAVWEPIVLRMGVPGSFPEALRGTRISELHRHGPFFVFSLPPLEMIVHFQVTVERGPLFSLQLSDKLNLHYLDSRRMGKIYVVKAGDTTGIPGFDTQGIDLLSPEFTLQIFK